MTPEQTESRITALRLRLGNTLERNRRQGWLGMDDVRAADSDLIELLGLELFMADVREGMS